MTIIRLSPSGPPITNSGGGPLEFGPGARLRLEEAVSTMGGSQAIPTDAPEFAVISPGGFTPAGDDPIVLTLNNPKEGLRYRANLALDISSNSTNTEGEIVLYLDTSVDGGTTWTNQAKNVHSTPININETADQHGFRPVQVWLPLTLGSDLGVDESVPSPSLKLRARAQQTIDAGMQVNSEPTATGVSGMNGTIHIELEECF